MKHNKNFKIQQDSVLVEKQEVYCLPIEGSMASLVYYSDGTSESQHNGNTISSHPATPESVAYVEQIKKSREPGYIPDFDAV